MSKITVDQKTIRELLTDKKSVFLIPDYQRSYAWEEEQCQTLWDDVFTLSLEQLSHQVSRHQLLRKSNT